MIANDQITAHVTQTALAIIGILIVIFLLHLAAQRRQGDALLFALGVLVYDRVASKLCFAQRTSVVRFGPLQAVCT